MHCGTPATCYYLPIGKQLTALPSTQPAYELDDETVARLRVAVGRLARELRTISAAEGLSPTESGVLAILDRAGAMRAGDLAEAEAINPTLLSRVVGRLEDAGLVARERDPDDGRASRVDATPAGRRLMRRLRSRRNKLLSSRLGGLGAAQVDALLFALPALEALSSVNAPKAKDTAPKARS